MIDNFRTLISGVLAKVSSLYAKKEDVYSKEDAASKEELMSLSESVERHEHPYTSHDYLRYRWPSTEDWDAIAYGNNKFVAVGGHNHIICSENGTTWTTTLVEGAWVSVAYGNGKFVVVGDDEVDLVYSEDGIVWTRHQSPCRLKKVCYGNGKFVAVGDGDVACSEDGITWTRYTLPYTTGSNDIAFGDNKIVIAASAKEIAAYSEDGMSWNETALPAAVNSIAYGNNRFVAIGTDGKTIAYSADGITWYKTTLLRIMGVDATIVYADNKFVTSAHGENTTFYSYDGVSWYESEALPYQGKFNLMTYADGKFLMLPWRGIDAIYSYDGITWYDTYDEFSQNGEIIPIATESYVDRTVSTQIAASLEPYATEEFVTEAIASIPTPDPGSGTNSPAIIDVTALPTEDIREDCFYRLLTAKFLYGQYLKNDWTMYTVDGLPETGEMCWDGTTATAYYNVADGVTYGYVDANVSAAMGVPVGWYTADVLIPAVGQPYDGVITDITQASDGTVYTYIQGILYSYSDGVWTKFETIGWRGTGENAEIFNSITNVASGGFSHAEGSYSHAEGNSAHAEGDYSHAEGWDSHAEGYASHAEGDSSHAEGYASHAEGDSSHAEGAHSHAEGANSHAEGVSSHAEGVSSHAEGYNTHAVGISQHVQGEYNVTDPDYNPDTPHIRSKYAHIVGNGTSDSNRSNAHTLDWNGLGWFAGGLKVGGTGQDDPNAKEIATKDYVDSVASSGGSGGGVSSWNDLNDKPFYSEPPKIDISWDGDMTGKFALPGSQIGFDEELYFVKVSDETYVYEDLVGAECGLRDMTSGESYSEIIDANMLDTNSYPGGIAIGGYGIIIHDSSLINAALGLPDGAITNGVYFTLVQGVRYVSSLIGPEFIQHLESKYIKDMYRTIPPKFEITWDGDMTGKFALPGSQIGFDEGVYFVKVSDEAYTVDDLIGAEGEYYYIGEDYSHSESLDSSMLDTDSYPGGIKIGSYGVVIYDATEINTALGLPDGTISNGVYFALNQDVVYTSRLTGPETVVTIDEKYLPETVATKDYVESLILGAIGGSY